MGGRGTRGGKEGVVASGEGVAWWRGWGLAGLVTSRLFPVYWGGGGVRGVGGGGVRGVGRSL